MACHNIVIFGEPGVGKSSLINMLAGETIACTEDLCLNRDHQDRNGVSVPLYCRSPSHVVDIDGQLFRLHEATAFTPDGAQSDTLNIVQAYTLIRRLKSGVNLLVFCMRSPRITDGAGRNWILFNEIFCQKRVPIVVTVTGLENDPNMDAWYVKNRTHFYLQGMYANAAACVTTIKGKLDQFGNHIFQQEFDASLSKIQYLIKSTYLKTPWMVEKVEWFNYYVPKVVDIKIFWLTTVRYEIRKKKRGAVHRLVHGCGMKKEDAMELAGMLQCLGGEQ